MSAEASAAQNTSVKDDAPTATTTKTEPVLNTQVEPSSDQPKSTEEEAVKQVEDGATNTTTNHTNDAPTSPTAAAEDISKTANAKLRAMFSTFSKASKKDVVPPAEETPATENTTEAKTGSSPPHNENKLSKGLGNLFARVKPATNKENENEAHTSKTEHTDAVVEVNENSSATPAATTTEAANPVNVTQDETPSSADHAAEHHPQKRQSLLSKFFGKKKEDEHAEKEHENEDHEPNTEREVENVAVQETAQASSPPLGRRLTGFFSKKMPKLEKNKHQKSSEKLETSDGELEAEAEGSKEGGNTTINAAEKELPQQPEVEVNAPITTTAEDTTEGLQTNNLSSNTPAIVAK